MADKQFNDRAHAIFKVIADKSELVKKREISLLKSAPDLQKKVQNLVDAHARDKAEKAKLEEQAQELANKAISPEDAAFMAARKGQSSRLPAVPAIPPEQIDYNRDGKPDLHANDHKQNRPKDAPFSGKTSLATGRQDAIGYRQRLDARVSAEQQLDDELDATAAAVESSAGLDFEETVNEKAPVEKAPVAAEVVKTNENPKPVQTHVD